MLQEFNIENNQITGDIRFMLRGMDAPPNLRSLRIGRNDFSGTLSYDDLPAACARL